MDYFLDGEHYTDTKSACDYLLNKWRIRLPKFPFRDNLELFYEFAEEQIACSGMTLTGLVVGISSSFTGEDAPAVCVEGSLFKTLESARQKYEIGQRQELETLYALENLGYSYARDMAMEAILNSRRAQHGELFIHAGVLYTSLWEFTVKHDIAYRYARSKLSTGKTLPMLLVLDGPRRKHVVIGDSGVVFASDIEAAEVLGLTPMQIRTIGFNGTSLESYIQKHMESNVCCKYLKESYMLYSLQDEPVSALGHTDKEPQYFLKELGIAREVILKVLHENSCSLAEAIELLARRGNNSTDLK